jgi:hypothetical protein
MPLPTISQVHVQAALTDLSIAYRQDAPAVSDILFPRVSVNKQSNKYYVWNKGDMWRAEARKRAPAADFARVGIRVSTDNYSAEQFALEYLIADEISANADAGIDIESTATMYLVDQLNLQKDLSFAADFFTASSGWTSGTVSTAWDTVATGTPVTNITNAVLAIKRALGASNQHRIIGLGGTKILNALITSDQVRDRTKYVQAGTYQGLQAALAPVLNLDELIISTREYNTAKEGRTASYSPVFDNDFLVVAVPRNPGLSTPAAGYTFAWDENGRGDMYVETYREEPKKSDVVRAVCYYDQKQTGADLGVYFDNPVT